MSHLHGIHVGFAKDRDFQYLEEYVPAVGDKLIAGEEAQTERLLITSTVFLMMSSMRNSLYDELYQIKDTKTEEKTCYEIGWVCKKNDLVQLGHQLLGGTCRAN